MIEIIKISYLKKNIEQLRGFAIDVPQQPEIQKGVLIAIKGWVVGKECPVTAIHLTRANFPDEKHLQKIEKFFLRADVAKYYADTSTEYSGFFFLVSMVGMPTDIILNLRVFLQNGEYVDIAEIQLHHRPLQSIYHPKLQPILVNSLGRSGSTWLMHLLAKCPNIIIQPDYPYEAHPAKYWLHTLFKFISEPTNNLNADSSEEFLTTTQWLNIHLYRDLAFREWFGNEYIEQTLAFCQKSIDQFYMRISFENQAENSESPYFFAEKFGPGNFSHFFYEIYPQLSEIILVRDFRDVLCSSISFTKKIGMSGFGLNDTQSNEEIIKVTKNRAQSILRTWKHRSAYSHLVRYEDLILNPIDTLDGILSYLKIEHDRTTIERILKNATENVPVQMQKQHQTTDSPQKSIGRWQQDLDDSLKALCAEHLTEELKAFGYD